MRQGAKLAVLLAVLSTLSAVAAPAWAVDVSLQVEGKTVDTDAPIGDDLLMDASAGIHIAFTENHGMRAHLITPSTPGGDLGAEIGYHGILPWRLEGFVGAGIIQFDDAEGETESDPFYRAGLYLRLTKLQHAAVLVGAGVQWIVPDEGEEENDLWFSLGFRGR
ncbi:MAG TPA: hypothetical protein VJV23_15955 [Candidatus Polarisedimenticolia bacterium]|nr:hypothetical protein [Candidatus Polarisedimenticolia bacterium]